MSACRLLILDDDPSIGLTLQLIAEASGASARLAASPDDFFAALTDWAPTHLCIDLNMPQMSGAEVLQALAGRGCAAQVIISSGVGLQALTLASQVAAGQGLTLCGVLPKPFRPAQLRELLKLPPTTPG